MLYFIWSNPNKIFTVVNAVAINVMVQCSETELDHYINVNGISDAKLLHKPKPLIKYKNRVWDKTIFGMTKKTMWCKEYQIAQGDLQNLQLSVKKTWLLRIKWHFFIIFFSPVSFSDMAVRKKHSTFASQTKLLLLLLNEYPHD